MEKKIKKPLINIEIIKENKERNDEIDKNINPKRIITHQNVLQSLFYNAKIESKKGKKAKSSKSLNIDYDNPNMLFEFDLERVYKNFLSFLSAVIKHSIRYNKTLEDNYLKIDLKKHEIDIIYNKFKVFNKKILKIKQFNSLIGIQLNFSEIFSLLWGNFTKDKSQSKLFKKNHWYSNIQFSERAKNALKIGLSVFAVIFVTIGLTMSTITNSRPMVVGKYDSVRINYQFWESNKYRDYDMLNPLFDNTIWITMIPITENSTSGLILGLYNNLLGKEVFYESGLIWLKKCIDQDRNGIDDITEEPALTFGNSSDQYFNTYLMIQFKVLNIHKYSEPKQLDLLQTFIMWILIILSSIGILTVFIYSIKIVMQRHRDKRNLSSFLKNIEGIKQYRKELVNQFRNVENLRKASKEEIVQIVGKKNVKKIYSFLLN